ncbi:MAG: glucosaminidase domain-containing protein, partial [Romboutsia sp.]
YNSLKHINKNDIDVYKYIDYADKISENKVQLNWKYIVAIIGVQNSNNFKDVSQIQIETVSKLFLNKSNNIYKLNTLKEVISKLELNTNETKKIYRYIYDLKSYGLVPNRLNDNTEYMHFINEIKESSLINYKKYKILPSITIAQAILESNWGKSRLAKDFNNLFGIKADKYWTGEYVTLETSEYSNTIINDKFRKYNNKNESLRDHAKFLSENERYKNNGVFNANTYIYQARALQSAGYSTIENDKGEKIYADMLINIIRQYNLQLIDSEVQSLKL